MNLFSFDDYKTAIRAKVKAQGKEHKGLNLKRVAEKIRIQYTYLSKVLNDDRTHLSEDHLFGICELLQLLPDEVDFLFLLRSLAVTQDARRRTFLQNKINLYRRKKQLDVPIQEFHGTLVNEEIGYLFDPYCVLIHVALFIKEYAEQPRRLCTLLGITPDRLELCLKRLGEMGFIELDERGNPVKVLKSKIHYGTNHPLMRVHQHLMRSIAQTQLVKTAEGEKHSFVSTFSSHEGAFRAIYERFQLFLKEAEAIVSGSPSQHTYQMQFDLFRWF